MLRNLATIGFIFTIGFLFQCGSRDQNTGKLIIGVGITNSQHAFYIELTDGYKAAAESLGVEIIIHDAKFDVARQAAAMEDFLTRGVDAIIVAPVTPGILEPFTEDARRQGIPVITESSQIDGETCFVATDNYRGGFIGGEYAGKILQQRGIESPKAAYIGDPKFPVCILRENGFMDGIKSVLPRADFVARQDGQGVMERALTVAENILQAHPHLDCIGGANDASALGALAALEAANRTETIVIGFDGGQDARDAIRRKSAMLASPAQRPHIIARTCMEMAVMAASGNPVPPVVQIDPVLIIRENLDKFEKELTSG